MKSLLIGLGLLMVVAVPSSAGPPVDAQRMTLPQVVLCTPTLTSMIEALTVDYAVHISITFEEEPEKYVIVVENPDTGTAAILHSTVNRTCLIYSGKELRHFVRPEGMPAPEVNVPGQKQQDVDA